jgi:hypothetical protein
VNIDIIFELLNMAYKNNLRSSKIKEFIERIYVKHPSLLTVKGVEGVKSQWLHFEFSKSSVVLAVVQAVTQFFRARLLLNVTLLVLPYLILEQFSLHRRSPLKIFSTEVLPLTFVGALPQDLCN